MKLVRTLVVVAAAACCVSGCWVFQEDCAHTYFGGGEATVTLVTGPDATETSWTVSGLEKAELGLLRATGPPANQSNVYPTLVAGEVGAVVSGFGRREALDSWVAAFVPVEEVPGLDCLTEPIVGFIVKGQLTPAYRPSVGNEILFVRGVDDVVMQASSDEEEGPAVMDFYDETSGVMSLVMPLDSPGSPCAETTVEVTLTWDLDPDVSRFEAGTTCSDWQFWEGY